MPTDQHTHQSPTVTEGPARPAEIQNGAVRDSTQVFKLDGMALVAVTRPDPFGTPGWNALSVMHQGSKL